jgi:hypothetical protein
MNNEGAKIPPEFPEPSVKRVARSFKRKRIKAT